MFMKQHHDNNKLNNYTTCKYRCSHKSRNKRAFDKNDVNVTTIIFVHGFVSKTTHACIHTLYVLVGFELSVKLEVLGNVTL